MPHPIPPPGVPLDTLGIRDWFEYGWPVGGEFLVVTPVRPDLNAYLAHWRQFFGPANMSQADAQAVYDLQFAALEEMDLIASDFDPDYADVAEADAELVIAVELLPSKDFNDLPTPT
jgi:hypothetical protein